MLERPGGKEGGGERKKEWKIVKKGRKMGKGGAYKVDFWNVAGLENKNREFWEKLGSGMQCS